MVTLSQKIQYLYPKSIPGIDWETKDVGGGPFINVWRLGAQPSQATLDTVTQAMIDADAVTAARAGAVAMFLNEHSLLAVIERAGLLVLLDQVNTLHTELQTLRDQVRAVAPTVPAVNYPQYTVTDLKAAVQSKVNSGASD